MHTSVHPIHYGLQEKKWSRLRRLAGHRLPE